MDPFLLFSRRFVKEDEENRDPSNCSKSLKNSNTSI
jgi:hypothetical protein